MATNRIPLSSQILIITLFVVFFSVLFSLSSAIYSNYQYAVKIKQFEEENQRYAEQNKIKMYEYLRSGLKLVLEKERKESMNEVNPGEQVIVINTNENGSGLFTVPTATKPTRAQREEQYKDLPNIQKWWHYFFDENIRA